MKKTEQIQKAIEDIRKAPEGPYLDRKSSRLAPRDIVKHVIAFANAGGGTLAIGIEDDGRLTGFTLPNSHDPEEYKEAIYSSCYPMPSFHLEKLPYGEDKNEYILLIQIDISETQVITKTPEKTVYLRISDKSKEISHDQITQLEYDRGQRFFEEREIADATIEEDIDREILESYCERMKTTTKMDISATLKARGLIRNGHLTNAAILLFGNNPTRFLPQARVRFIRYDGMKKATGQRINIIKEKTFDCAIPRILQEIAPFVSAQMREFQILTDQGQFKIIPEYPEFAWLEGIVNALTHRDYSMAGDHIRISMYDDRLEIFSPGKLPNVVTLQNMKYTRFSRNPKIARILTELGWVKELNEGVNRIYDEMQLSFLKEPTYSEPNDRAVMLLLENSITSRNLRVTEQLSQRMASEWNTLSPDEQTILQYMYCHGPTKVKELTGVVQRSNVFVRERLKRLLEKEIVEWYGNSPTDPHQYYQIKSFK